MAVFRWRSPFYEHFREFGEINRLQDEVNHLYETFFGKKPVRPRTDVFPPVNVSEDHDNIYATAELPGVGPEDIDITVDEDSLTLKGSRKIQADTEGISYHRREREEGAFNRKVSLPTRIITDKVHAETKDGILTVSMPKAEEVKPKTIEIKVQ
jgi:HSP20 family protein